MKLWFEYEHCYDCQLSAASFFFDSTFNVPLAVLKLKNTASTITATTTTAATTTTTTTAGATTTTTTSTNFIA